MSEWQFAQLKPEDRLARVEHFSMIKRNADGREFEFFITLREYMTPKDPTMRFYATADRQTNQKTMAFTPCGWGGSMLEALSSCVREVYRFDYEGEIS